MPELTHDHKVFTVSSLNRSAKSLLESHFQIVWVEGEISNLSRPSSGHIYFTLKDDNAQVRCAMFRFKSAAISFQIENGLQILARAKLSLYEGRGDYQLIIEHLEDRGEGILRRRFETLKQKLSLEGLFDPSHKKTIPPFPACIGVITSPTGAAIRDVLSVLKRRFPIIPILIYPTPVQGENASEQIVNSIITANKRNECDILILCRGGGSLEDLWSFNEENVARAIFQSNIPIVTGIGHEIDFTIADFAADVRSATPSAAAELVSPDGYDYLQHIDHIKKRLIYFTSVELKQLNQLVTNLANRFSKADLLLRQYIQSVDFLEQRLVGGMQKKFNLSHNKLQCIQLKLSHLNPVIALKEQSASVRHFKKTLEILMQRNLQAARQKWTETSRMLHAVSPLQTLERGYSITTQAMHVIDDISKVDVSDEIKIEVRNGYIFCTIDQVKAKKKRGRSQRRAAYVTEKS